MWAESFQLRRHTSPINCVDISPDMMTMATASSDRSVGITNLKTKNTTYLRSHSDSVLCVSYSPDAQHLVSCSNDGNAILWNAQNNEQIGQFRGHRFSVRSVCWSPDSKYIATASNDGTAAVWSLHRFARRRVLTGMSGWVRDVKWHGNTIAIAGNDPYLHVFDPRYGKEAMTTATNTQSDISSLSFHHSGNYIAAGSFDHIVRIWDLRNFSMIQKHSAHTDSVTKVAFGPFTDDLLSVGRDGAARMWDLHTGSVVANFRQHESAVLGCSWMPYERGFVTCGEDWRLCGYVQTPQPIDPMTLELDGDDLASALERVQDELNSLTRTMKTLDRRLVLQEEKLQWLADVDESVSKK